MSSAHRQRKSLKRTFTGGQRFFKSDDLEKKTLGIDRGGQASVEAAIKAYIRDYDLDEEKLDEAKASLQSILENAEGLTAEELQESISKIFENRQVRNNPYG